MTHLLLALPTLSASHDTTAEARDTHLLSLSFGVNVATREATAITLAAICRKVSTFSVMYSIIGVTSCLVFYARQLQKVAWAWQLLSMRRAVGLKVFGTRPNGNWHALNLRCPLQCFQEVHV